MDEQALIKKAKNELTKEGGFAWSGYRGRDIFNIFDIIFLAPNGAVSFFQVSTMDHKWSREQKIHTFRMSNGLPDRSYLMLWDYRQDQFVTNKL